MIEQMLKLTAMGNFRADESVARQAVMNHTTTAHFMDMSFVRDSTKIGVAEAYAMQGLAMAQLPSQAAGINLSSRNG
jgi:hypothetical protein